jgi:hemopoietic cell kinase
LWGLFLPCDISILGGIIHRNLKPANIFVDWDWIVRVGDFSHSVLWDEPVHGPAASDWHLSIDVHDRAPECLEERPTLKSDIHSFGLILDEFLSGEPGFARDSTRTHVVKQICQDEARPHIPDFLKAGAWRLIQDCWAQDPDERPSFVEILFRLDKMDFRIMGGVKSAKVVRFVKAVKSREKDLGIEIEGPN